MFLMGAGVCNASGDVSESLAKWSPGKRIEVNLNKGDKLIGRLGTVESDRFVLEPDNRKGARHVLRFEEVRSVSAKMTTGRKWAIAGGVYAVLIALGLVLGN
jgi:hypothetical protein